MRVPVGHLTYELRLVGGYIEHEGRRLIGLCDADRQRILVSDQVPAEKRLGVMWHELAHAWQAELDVHQRLLDAEGLANLVGLAMSAMSAAEVAGLHIYMTQGIEPDAVLMLPSIEDPIPVLRYAHAAEQSA